MMNTPKKAKPESDPEICRWISNFISKPAHEKKLILFEIMTEYNIFVDLHKQLYVKSPNETSNLYTQIYKQRKSRQYSNLGSSKKMESRKMSNQSMSIQNITKNDQLLSTCRSISNIQQLKGEQIDQMTNKLKQLEHQLKDKDSLITQLQQQKQKIMTQHKTTKDKFKYIMGVVKKQLKQMKNLFQNTSLRLRTIQTLGIEISSFVHRQLRTYGQLLLKPEKQKYQTLLQTKIKAEQNKERTQKERIQIIKILKQIIETLNKQSKKQLKKQRQTQKSIQELAQIINFQIKIRFLKQQSVFRGL